MSSDHRTTVVAWASVVAGAAHLVAAGTGASAAHGHGPAPGAVHAAAVAAIGVAQLGLGGSLLQRPDGRHRRAAACGLAVTAAVAYLVELAGGGHRADVLGVLTVALAAVMTSALLVRTHVRVRVAAGAVSLVLVGTGLAPMSVHAGAADDNQPAGCTTPNRRMTLYAQQLPSEGDQIRLGWGLSPTTASIPGPLIEMVEGDCLAITVVNNVPKATLEGIRKLGSTDPVGVSLHVHGVKYRPSSDGTRHHDSWVPPGRSRTFVWYAQPRVVAAGRVTSNGTAGSWWYHDHVVGTDHGTGGVGAGLVGGLVVRRATDAKPDRTFTVVMGPTNRLNFRAPKEFCTGVDPAPSDSCFRAEEGERIEFLVVNVGNDMHTFHLHGHNWADNRTGIPDVATDTQLIDARILGPSESFGFQVVAGESVGAGTWMLHCHVQSHSDAGMTTDFRVGPAGEGPTDPVDGLPVHDH